MTVLVAGATGTTGAEVLRQLLEAGVPLRAMTRSERSAATLRDRDVPAAVADLDDPGSVAAALEGIDAAYVATSASDTLAAQEGALARAAAAAGVQHLVKLSVIGADADSPLTFARLHHAAEQAILKAGIACTMVRPNGFMQNTLTWSAQVAGGAIRGPVLDARWSIVDVRDVAAVAVAALRDPGAHAGEIYTCTGPQASSPREQIATLADLLGTPLHGVEVTIEQAQEAIRGTGIPAWSAEKLSEHFQVYADGQAEAVSPDIARVTGTAPRTYRQFAQDHIEAFRA